MEQSVDIRAVPQVPPETIRKWQEIVDLLAEILCVPSALIMKVEPPNIKVFVSSESTGNPYERDELACLNTGLYCETVMKTRGLLLVPDALVHEDWNANPDLKLGMISYMGLPVAWPNGNIFGTICVLDTKRNEYGELYRKLLFQCREILQADLKSLLANTELEHKVLERTAELRRNEAYLTQAQRLSRTGSFGWMPSSGQMFWSEESFRIFEYGNALAPTIDMILQRIHPEDLARVKSTIDLASGHGKSFDIEHRLLMPDGSVKHIHAVAHVVPNEAGQLEFNGAVMDITAAKQAEEELHKTRTELAHVAHVTTVGELSASIAHEINQPLSVIVTRASAALRWLRAEKPNIEKAVASLEGIVAGGLRAGDIVTSIRAMFKNDASEKVPTNINDIILAVLSIVRVELQKHSVELHTQLNEHLPTVQGDKLQLQQVVLNLVMNGIEAMGSVRPRVLKVLTDQTKSDMVRVLIEDTGTGIDPSNLDQIFKPLFTTKANGMGIGLSICHSIIKSHNGRIWVSDGRSGGSIFQIELPANVIKR
jgi:C4-dicarboxylate-specific signal transduction histidine kinase